MSDAITGTIVDWDSETGGHVRIDDTRTLKLEPKNVPIGATLGVGSKVSISVNIFGVNPHVIEVL